MFEESVSSIPSIWASMNSWLTPTVLFLLLNVMIGTIAIASSLGTNQKHRHHHQDQHHQGHQLARSPSVLQRFRSMNFYAHRSPEPATIYEEPPESESHGIQHHQLPRSPSVLERLQSIKFQFQFRFPRESSSPLQPPQAQVPDPEPERETEPSHFDFSTYDLASSDEDLPELEQEEEEEELLEYDEDQFGCGGEENKEQTLDEIYKQLQLQEHHVSRTTSDTKPASGEVPSKLPKKMKKSASAKSAFAHFKADDIVEMRRPATVRENNAKKASEDHEVDAKADDFINRFKHQLKLQRIDSIIRYKDMINRGT